MMFLVLLTIELCFITYQIFYVTFGPQMVMDECEKMQKLLFDCLNDVNDELMVQKVRCIFFCDNIERLTENLKKKYELCLLQTVHVDPKMRFCQMFACNTSLLITVKNDIFN